MSSFLVFVFLFSCPPATPLLQGGGVFLDKNLRMLYYVTSFKTVLGAHQREGAAVTEESAVLPAPAEPTPTDHDIACFIVKNRADHLPEQAEWATDFLCFGGPPYCGDGGRFSGKFVPRAKLSGITLAKEAPSREVSPLNRLRLTLCVGGFLMGLALLIVPGLLRGLDVAFLSDHYGPPGVTALGVVGVFMMLFTGISLAVSLSDDPW